MSLQNIFLRKLQQRSIIYINFNLIGPKGHEILEFKEFQIYKNKLITIIIIQIDNRILNNYIFVISSVRKSDIVLN